MINYIFKILIENIHKVVILVQLLHNKQIVILIIKLLMKILIKKEKIYLIVFYVDKYMQKKYCYFFLLNSVDANKPLAGI